MKSEELMKLVRTHRFNKAYPAMRKGYPAIRKWIKQNSGTQQEAEDVFQEALLVFCTKCKEPNFELTVDIKTYLFSVSKNLWFKELRKKKKENAITQEEVLNEEWEEPRFKLAEKAFATLGENCQKVLQYFYVVKLSFKEIAQKMDYASDKVAKNQKYRCLQKVRGLFTDLNKKGGEVC